MTAIEWTDATWNPVTGCSKVSPGCAHCYAETLSHRWGWTSKPWTPENASANVVLHPERLSRPLSWRKPRMVFVNSMSDLFHENVPDAFIKDVFAVMQEAERHTFQVLTKRPERMAEWTQKHQPDPLPNVWLGTSIENMRWVSRADVLREVPAAVRFISAEPLLGPLVQRVGCGACMDWPDPDCKVCEGLQWWWDQSGLDLHGIDWLIVGGESGPNHRPMDAEWVRDLRHHCELSDTAFFFKQWGGRTPKAGGRELDGREWSEYPVTEMAARERRAR